MPVASKKCFTVHYGLPHVFALIKQYLVFLLSNIVYIIPSVASSEIVNGVNKVENVWKGANSN